MKGLVHTSPYVLTVGCDDGVFLISSVNNFTATFSFSFNVLNALVIKKITRNYEIMFSYFV